MKTHKARKKRKAQRHAGTQVRRARKARRQVRAQSLARHVI